MEDRFLFQLKHNIDLLMKKGLIISYDHIFLSALKKKSNFMTLA